MDAHELPPPMQMVQLLFGFQLSQAVYVAAKLGVADHLTDGPRPATEVAELVGADSTALRRLLRTLAAVGVFSEDAEGRVGLTPLGATLVSDAPGSMRDLALMWMETHYGPFGDLLHTARTGEPAAQHHYGQPFWAWLSQHPEQVARFSRAMANLTDGIKFAAVASCDLSGATTLVDVGGADGSVLALLLERYPTLRGVLFDLPHVVPAGEKLLADRGLAPRVEVVGGDFFAAVPGGDAYLCSFVLHDWSDDEALAILRTIRAAAVPGARLRILELLVPPGDEPHLAKTIDLTMLGMLSGRERTEAELVELARQAGFRVERVVATPSPMSIVEAVAV
jgi:hypothetical protein